MSLNGIVPNNGLHVRSSSTLVVIEEEEFSWYFFICDDKNATKKWSEYDNCLTLKYPISDKYSTCTCIHAVNENNKNIFTLDIHQGIITQ